MTDTEHVPDERLAEPRPPIPQGWSLIRKIVTGAVVLTLGIVVLVVGAALFVVGTQPGTRWALAQGLARSPVPASVAGVEGTLLGPLTLSGLQVDYRGADLRIERVVLDWRPTKLLGRQVWVDSLFVTGVEALVPAELEPAPTPQAPPPEPAPGPPSIPELPVTIQLDTVLVEVAGVVLADRATLEAATVGGSGSLESLHLEASVAGVAAPLEGFQAHATMDGAPEAYQLQASVDVSYPDLPPVSATLASSGSLTGVEIQEALVQTAEGNARLSGAAEWYPAVSWAVDAIADGFQVGPFTPAPEEWPGAISFRMTTEGGLEEAGPAATVLLQDLSGTLREQPLSGGIDVWTEAGALEVRQMEVAWGGLRLDAAGEVTDALDLTFGLDVPDLGLALPGGGGSLAVEGSVSGPRTEPRLIASLTGDEVRSDSLSVGAVRGEVQLDLAPGSTNRIDLRAISLASGATAVDSILVTGEGTREDHHVGVRGWMGSDGLGTGLSGGIQGGGESGAPLAWTGTLDSLAVRTELAGEWGLNAPAELAGSADSASIGEACLDQAVGDARACVAGAWSRTGGAGGELRLEMLPLSLLTASAPEGITVEGLLQGQATFALGPDGSLGGEGVFTAEGDIDALSGAESVGFRLGGDGVRFAVDEAGASASLDFALVPEAGSGDVRATGDIRLPGLVQLPVVPEEQPLEGSLVAVSDDLGFLAVFVPQVSRAGGRMDLETTLSGTLAQPEILGGLVVADGELDVPEAGLELRGLTVEAQGEPGGAVSLDARVESGDGFMTVSGQVSALPSPETPAELEVSGEAFRAVSTPEIQVEIAPDLQVSFDGEVTTVRGELNVPWARVELVEIPEVAVPPSPDVVFVGEEPAPLPLVDAQVQVHVGDDVFFSGFGFTSNIEGDVLVTQAPGADPLTQGEFSFIDGRFAAYGQNLEIDPGRVILAGPPVDATLDVTAERLAQDGTTAGVQVTGPALDPTISLISDPAQSDADALSYIMYGRSLSEGDATQQQQVVGAAANLGANVLTTQLAGSVGLDEARIEGTTRDTAELVAGKYLSPSVFVAYGRGLFKPTNTFRLKYLLSSSWALQAESGEANGGDVLYQIERGN